MCGICGIIDYRTNAQGNERRVRDMCARMRHRGPDDEGVYSSGGTPSAVLGHRRLSIIDLSPAGRQPMSNEKGTVWVVLNGEIYNFLELRSGLIENGHIFKSHTDTEVIVHLYEEYGEECVSRLDGMFSFALWDESKKILLAARDRAGKKPFFYHYANGVFSFASELSALLACGTASRDISPQSLDFYLGFGYVPAPATIYKGIHKLMPGHSIVLSGNDVKESEYWKLSYGPKHDIAQADAEVELMRLFDTAVKKRLYSDVPLGAFLSGGVDSSAVVAVMARHSRRVKTFSIGFEDENYSELAFARSIAQRYDTDHHEFVVKPNALEILPALIEHYGEPYADSSCIPTYYVSRETKRYVTVALNGDGGDESFGGYERYQAMLIAERLASMPDFARVAARMACSLLPDSIEPKNRFRRMRRFMDAAFLPRYQRYMKWVSIFDESLKRELYHREFSSLASQGGCEDHMRRLFEVSRHPAMLDTLLDIDVHSYLPDDLLVKVDIASMANSLECRSPFLDTRLMEFAARLPGRFKLRGSEKKFILKKIFRQSVPHENLYRRKMGFGVPVGKWFRMELKGFLEDTLLGGSFSKRKIFDPAGVRRMVSLHAGGIRDFSFQLWALLVLELWYRRFMD